MAAEREAGAAAEVEADAGVAAPAAGAGGGERRIEEEGYVLEFHDQRLKPEELMVRCSLFFDEAVFCTSPLSQFRHNYAEGEFENCNAKWGHFYDCMAFKHDSKLSHNQKLAKFHALMRQYQQPTDVWDYKDRGSW